MECFCFEEQKLLAGEEVDMPLLFFIDKDVLDDPACRNLDDIVLSYTFFKWVSVLIIWIAIIRGAHRAHSGRDGMHKANWNQTRPKM